MAGSSVRVQGLRELNRAFARAPKTLNNEWRTAQRSIAEPVRAVAEARAATEIHNMPRSPAWGQMRVGITQRSVYVAPRKRGARAGARKRPNLAGLLMDRAMAPALAARQAEAVRRLERVLETVGRDWER